MDLTSNNASAGLRRLYHQRISHPPFKDASQVVAWLGAMQGQDYLGTKWAFGLRLPGSTEAAVEPLCQVTGQLEMLTLILPDGD